MVSIRGAVIGLCTGILAALAWAIFIDGQIHVNDSFPPLHILPPLFATGAGVMLNFATVEDVEEKPIAKVWLFIWMTVLTVCIGSSVFILSTNYPIDDNYAGVSLMLNTVLVMFAAILFFVGRSRIEA